MRRSQMVGFESLPHFGDGGFLNVFGEESDEYPDEDSTSSLSTKPFDYYDDSDSPSVCLPISPSRPLDSASTTTSTTTTSSSFLPRHPVNLDGFRELIMNQPQTKVKESPTESPLRKTELLEMEPAIDDMLVSIPPEWALCSVCHEIFKKPTITRCGHTFCHECILEVINRKVNCPLCRKKIDGISDISTNYQMKQVISGLVVRCKYGLRVSQSPPLLPITPLATSPPSLSEVGSGGIGPTAQSPRIPTSLIPSASSSTLPINIPTITSPTLSAPSTPRHGSVDLITRWEVTDDGCSTTFEFGEKGKHEAECDHAPIRCFNEGCVVKVKRKELEKHMTECPFRVLKCVLCSEMIQFQYQEKHALICPEKTIHCPYKCGKSFFRRQQEDHLAECPLVEAACPHAHFGCQFSGQREQLQEHVSRCIYEQLKGYLGLASSEMQQLVKLTRNQQRDIRQLQSVISNQQTEIRALRAQITQLQPQRSRSFTSIVPFSRSLGADSGFLYNSNSSGPNASSSNNPFDLLFSE